MQRNPAAGRDPWELVAPEWEHHRVRLFDAFRSASQWVVDAVAPQPGDTILELAAGPGETGFLALDKAGPTGRLISTDLAPTMVQAARRGAEARGLTNVDCRVMDAQSLDLDAASVDAVISRLGLMLVPDPRAVLREVRRVLRPGGRVAYAVMGPPDRNQWMSLVMGALARVGRGSAGDDPFAVGGVFGLSSPEVNGELLEEAGFSDVHCGMLTGSMRVADADDLWDLQTKIAGPVRVAVESMTSEEIDKAREALGPMVAAFTAAEGGVELPTGLVTASAISR
jgi:SAM-dependent methyltransferase